jgi:nucleoid DNA-binding protein
VAEYVLETTQRGSAQPVGIGKRKLGESAERQGRNPVTDEAMTTKAGKTLKISGGIASSSNRFIRIADQTRP